MSPQTKTTGHEHEYEAAILQVLARHVPDPPDLQRAGLQFRALRVLREAYHASTPRQRSRLRKAGSLPPAHDPTKGGDPPPWLVELVGELFGISGLHRFAETHHPRRLKRLGEGGTLAAWLAEPPFELTEQALAAGRRAGLALSDDQNHDHTTIEALLGPVLRSHDMATQEIYTFDPRALPPGSDGLQLATKLAKTVREVIGPDATEAVVGFILGALSLDGRALETDLITLRSSIRQLRNETEGTTDSITRATDGTPGRLANTEAIELIERSFDRLRGGDKERSYYEELAFVGRALISNARNVPVDSSGIDARVSNLLSTYVPGQFGGSLSLPEFEAPDVAGSDLVGDNIRAVALVYAAWNLEELKLFTVLDRVLEVFMNGQLPVGFDNGGRALAEYYFSDNEQKLTEAARRMTYSRVLGVSGGEISKEAPPNRQFQDLFLRFLSSLSEFDRQRRIADVVAGSRPTFDTLSLTAEQVRKSGRDLAANMTLYGYGGTFFVAQKLKDQIARALKILSTPEILAAYGVQSPFQVIERVVASDLGGTVPNTLRLKTMAESGKRILDTIGNTIPAWLGSQNPLFEPRGDVTFTAANGRTADIDLATEQQLLRDTEHWLAVNGIKDEQRARLGEPEISAAAPSIPQAGGNAPAFDQLRQLVSTGQAPSLDQLKALLPDMNGALRV